MDNNFNYDHNDSASNDYGGEYYYDQGLDRQKRGGFEPPNGFATAALVLGICSLAMCCCFYLSIPMAALGILFAILSKRERQMSGRARSGLWLSIAGLCLTVLLTVSVLVTSLNSGQFQDYLGDYLEYYMGDDYEEYWNRDNLQLDLMTRQNMQK